MADVTLLDDPPSAAPADDLDTWFAVVLGGVDPALVAAWAAERLVESGEESAGAAERAIAVAGVIERLGAAAARTVGALDASKEWQADGATSTTAWVRHRCGVAGGTAARWVAAGRLARRHAVVDDALVDGEVGLDGLTRLARSAGARRKELFDRDVDLLVDHARRLHPDDLATALRRWEALADDEAERRDDADREERRGLSCDPTVGGFRLAGWLGIEGAFVDAALAALTEPPDPKGAPVRRTLAQRRADALTDLCQQWLADRGLDLDDLADDGADGLDDGLDGGDDDPADGWAEPGRGERPAPGPQRAGGGGRGDPAAGGDPGAAPGGGPGSRATDGEEDLDREAAGEGGGRCGDGAEPFVVDPDDPATMERARQVRRARRAQHGSRRRARRARGPATAVEVRVDAGVLRSADQVPDDLTLESCDVVGLGPVGRAAVERFLCDAWIGRLVADGRSAVLDVGQRSPTFTRAQRRAIARRDRHCAHPGCDRDHRWCDVHHLVHREHEGPTSVDNGVLLCRWHHTRLHLHGQRLRRMPDGSYVLLERHDPEPVWGSEPGGP